MRALTSSPMHIAAPTAMGMHISPSALSLSARPVPHAAHMAPKLQLHAAPALRRAAPLARAQQDDAAGAPAEEDPEEDWGEEEGPSVDDFEDVTITGLGEDDA
jgi:hypothetical protein